jgi:hypothetical protein
MLAHRLSFCALLTSHEPAARVTVCNVEASVQDRSRRRLLRAAAIVALPVAAGVAVWAFMSRDDHSKSTTPPTVPAHQQAAKNTVTRARPRSLATLSRTLGQPIFWVGPETKKKLELTQTPSKRVYIRYLPLRVPIGDRSGGYLIIGTYRVDNAYRAIRRASRELGAHLLRLRGGTIGVYNDNSPTNVYFAAPHSNYQVEVYHPNPKVALALVRSGRVRPIG